MSQELKNVKNLTDFVDRLTDKTVSRYQTMQQTHASDLPMHRPITNTVTLCSCIVWYLPTVLSVRRSTKLVKFSRFGVPGIILCRMKWVPVPEPEDDQVLIQVEACGLSSIRLDVIRELSLDRQHLPIGREVAGVITKIGGSVSRCKVGDEVAAFLPVDSLCSGCAEYCLANEYDLVLKPMRVSFHDAAACIRDAVKAYTALHYMARVCAGDTVLVINGASSSGTIAIQLAQHWGAKVLATASSQEESIYLESFKPELAQVIETDQSKKYALTQQCIEETGGLGVDCILDDGVSMFPKEEVDPMLSPRKQKKLQTLPTKHEVISALGVGGRWVTTQMDLQLDPPDSRLLHMRGASVSFLNETVWNLSCGQLGRFLHILQCVINEMGNGVLRPNISRCVSMEEACKAYNSLPAQRIGKTIVKM